MYFGTRAVGQAFEPDVKLMQPQPSLNIVRQLAKELVINPNTVAKAYSELTRDGVLEGQAGRGYIVASRKNVYSKAERLRRLDHALDAFVSESLTLGFSPDEITERLTNRLEKMLPT